MSMPAYLRQAVVAAVLTIVTVASRSAHAGASLDSLTTALASDDARVRANAALALGASNDDRAVTPLCGALGDASELVRTSSAAGLKKLARTSALGCLTNRKASETSAAVKKQLDAAITALQPAAKYYVAVAPPSNKTGRSDVSALASQALRNKLASLGPYQIAPTGEKTAAAKAVIAKKKLKGFYLTVSVEPFDYTNGTKAQVKVAIFTYPNKDLRGESPGRARSTSKADKSTEDALVTAAIETAIDTFNKNVDQF